MSNPLHCPLCTVVVQSTAKPRSFQNSGPLIKPSNARSLLCRPARSLAERTRSGAGGGGFEVVGGSDPTAAASSSSCSNNIATVPGGLDPGTAAEAAAASAPPPGTMELTLGETYKAFAERKCSSLRHRALAYLSAFKGSTQGCFLENVKLQTPLYPLP